MKREINHVTLPTDFNPERKVLFIRQVDYKTLNSTSFYTWPTKEDCEGELTTAIFTVKPKP